MKARYFFAPYIFNTWPKVAILTSDGVLYSNYKVNLKLEIHEEKVDYKSFKVKDFMFRGYQPIFEISKEEALNAKLIEQENWVKDYLKEKGID